MFPLRSLLIIPLKLKNLSKNALFEVILNRIKAILLIFENRTLFDSQKDFVDFILAKSFLANIH
jgi:hypothetical protein